MRLTRCLLRYGGTLFSKGEKSQRAWKNIPTHGGTRTPNLRFRRPTPYPLGHAGWWQLSAILVIFEKDLGNNKNKILRRPGIEPGSQEWESCMIPLHQRRNINILQIRLFDIILLIISMICQDLRLDLNKRQSSSKNSHTILISVCQKYLSDILNSPASSVGRA